MQAVTLRVHFNCAATKYFQNKKYTEVYGYIVTYFQNMFSDEIIRIIGWWHSFEFVGFGITVDPHWLILEVFVIKSKMTCHWKFI